MNRKLFCIVGQTGAGKSTVLDLVLKDRFLHEVIGMEPLVYSTTRPARKNEVDGFDYNFRTYEYYQDLKEDEIIELRTYDTLNAGRVHYFTTVYDLNNAKSRILICAASADQVKSYIKYASNKENKFDVYIINIHSTTKDRMLRVLNKRDCTDETCKELCRRILEEDFEYSQLKYSLEEGIYKQYPDRLFLDVINNGVNSFENCVNILYKITDFVLEKCKDN